MLLTGAYLSTLVWDLAAEGVPRMNLPRAIPGTVEVWRHLPLIIIIDEFCGSCNSRVCQEYEFSMDNPDHLDNPTDRFLWRARRKSFAGHRSL
jgi:hypothetical protein